MSSLDILQWAKKLSHKRSKFTCQPDCCLNNKGKPVRIFYNKDRYLVLCHSKVQKFNPCHCFNIYFTIWYPRWDSVTLHTRSRQFPITLRYFRLPYSLCHSYNDQYHFGNNPKHLPRRYRHHCRRLGDFKHEPRLTTVGFASGNLSLCADLILHT